MSHGLDLALVLAAGLWAVYFLWRRHVRRKASAGSNCGHCDGGSCPSRKA